MSKTYNIKAKTNFTTFDGPEGYADYISRIPQSCRSRDNGGGQDDFYGDNYETANNKLANGSMEYVDRAQALIDKMADEHVFASHQPQIEPGIVGFIPNVPNALAGQPYDMFNIVITDEQSITTPINIYVETLVSGGITQEQLIARGVCVMAFVLAMNNIRPVELWTICIGQPSGGKTGGIVCKVPSKPLDIQRAAFMLCDPAYYRRLAFASMVEHTSGEYNGWIQWPWNNEPTRSDHEPMFRELLDMNEDDIFIPGGYLMDELMKRDPVQWVKDQIHKHSGTKQEDGDC